MTQYPREAMLKLFHIGYPKAASTTLQKGLFANHKNIINFGTYPTGNIGKDSEQATFRTAYIFQDPRIQELHSAFTQRDGVLFEENEIKYMWNALLEDYYKENSTVVFSNERFLSSRFSNPEICEKARRIQRICPDAKILIIIRSQQDILKALYRDHPFDPRTLNYQPNPVSFSQWLELDLALSSPNLTNTLLFNRVVEIYEQLFPENRILVLPLELLKKERDSFVQQLSDFVEIDVEETLCLLKNKHENQGVSSFGNQYRRLRSYLKPYTKILRPARGSLKLIDQYLFNAARSVGETESIVLTENDLSRLREKYAEDNTLLSKRRNLQLQNLGYLFSETAAC